MFKRNSTFFRNDLATLRECIKIQKGQKIYHTFGKGIEYTASLFLVNFSELFFFKFQFLDTYHIYDQCFLLEKA